MSLELQDGGGGEATSGQFTVLGQAPTILVQGAGTVVDAMTITVNDSLYGVIFSFTITRADWLGTGTQLAAQQYATWVQAIGALPSVVGLGYAQDVNAAGLLIDMLIVTVGTPDGLQTAIATVPLATSNSPAAFAAIAAAYAQLTAVAALT